MSTTKPKMLTIIKIKENRRLIQKTKIKNKKIIYNFFIRVIPKGNKRESDNKGSSYSSSLFFKKNSRI